MNRSRIFRTWFTLVIAGLASLTQARSQSSSTLTAQDTAAAAAAPTGLRAGFAERDISPAIGDEAPGGYGKAYHTAFHDACKARASVFDDGQHVVAVVGVDALLIRRPTVDEARRRITERTGIPAEQIMIAASHTHAGGPTGMVLQGEFDDDSELVQSLAYDKTVVAPAEYLEKVVAGISDAVIEAYENRVAAKGAAGFGLAESVAFNRRFRMASGYSMTHPGVGNPDILEPAGPVDEQVGVLGAWNAEGQLLGCIVNFACHATTGPGGISADYVHYIERAIRGVMGDEVIVVFVAGDAGDITQVDNRTPYAITQFGERAARLLGGTVGAEALKTLLKLEVTAGSEFPVAALSKRLEIPRRPPRPERVAAAMELVQKDPATVDATEWTFAKEIVLLDARLKREPIAEVEVQAIQIGPVVLLSCPAEYFVQHGLDIKAGSPFPVTMPVSLANDCIGYVPSEEAFSPRGGGYETRLTSYSNLIPSAGRTIADSLIEMSKQLTPGAIPMPAPAAEFRGQPWTYGSLPPELD